MDILQELTSTWHLDSQVWINIWAHSCSYWIFFHVCILTFLRSDIVPTHVQFPTGSIKIKFFLIRKMVSQLPCCNFTQCKPRWNVNILSKDFLPALKIFIILHLIIQHFSKNLTNSWLKNVSLFIVPLRPEIFAHRNIFGLLRIANIISFHLTP